MPTYKQIQDRVKSDYGRVPKSCWIAHCKEMAGLPVRRAPNRQSNARMVPCENAGMREAIFSAFKHFGMISDQRNLQHLRE